MRKFLLLNICVLILSFLALAVSASAQKIRFVEKTLHFPNGSNSVTLTGTVTYKVRPLYVFRARKGERISVRITSDDDKAFFNVFDRAERQYNGVDGDYIPNGWSYTFTGTDNYELVVFLNEGAAKYTLEVKLK